MALYKAKKLAEKPVLFRKFGTARFRLRKFPDLEIEIVQTRKAKYTPSTKNNPELAFGTIHDDCIRRDLTINTLFYDISADRMLDLTGRAIDDIHHHRICTPMDPEDTFDDDPLRMLRVVRFASRYNATIDDRTLTAMTRMAPRLAEVSAERLRNEFERILSVDDPRKAMGLLLSVGALRVLIPEFFEGEESLKIFAHSLDVLNDIESKDVCLRWAALLHDIGKMSTRGKDGCGRTIYLNHESQGARIARRILRRFHADSPMVNRVMFLIRNHIVGTPAPTGKWQLKDKQLRRLQLECGTRENFNDLMTLIRANRMAYAKNALTFLIPPKK